MQYHKNIYLNLKLHGLQRLDYTKRPVILQWASSNKPVDANLSGSNG